MKRSLLLTTVTLGLLFTACKKSSTYTTSTGQPEVSYQLATQNTSYPITAPASGQTSGIQWTSGFANPDAVIFEAQQNDVQVQFRSTNTQQIDLMAPLAASFGGFALPAGFYNKIELKIDLDRNSTTPAMQLNGQFTNGTLSIPLMLQVNRSVELQTDEDSVTITTDSSYIAVTTIDLSTVTSGITATMLLNAKLTNGTIVISDESNQNLYGMVIDNLEQHHHHCYFEHHHH